MSKLTPRRPVRLWSVLAWLASVAPPMGVMVALWRTEPEYPIFKFAYGVALVLTGPMAAVALRRLHRKARGFPGVDRELVVLNFLMSSLKTTFYACLVVPVALAVGAVAGGGGAGGLLAGLVALVVALILGFPVGAALALPIALWAGLVSMFVAFERSFETSVQQPEA